MGLASLQLVGTGVGTPVAPFTAAKEAALLTVFRDLLPPLFLGLGPKWARIVNVTYDTAADTTNLTILCCAEVPPIHNKTAANFTAVRLPRSRWSQRLTTSVAEFHFYLIRKKFMWFSFLLASKMRRVQTYEALGPWDYINQ